jgi:hypothetical protein
MSDNIRLEEKQLSSLTPSGAAVQTDTDPASCKMHGKGWLRGGLIMAICCAAPLLLIAAFTLFGISLGALASGFLSLAALLACPVGMYLMMRMMAKEKK